MRILCLLAIFTSILSIAETPTNYYYFERACISDADCGSPDEMCNLLSGGVCFEDASLNEPTLNDNDQPIACTMARALGDPNWASGTCDVPSVCAGQCVARPSGTSASDAGPDLQINPNAGEPVKPHPLLIFVPAPGATIIPFGTAP